MNWKSRATLASNSWNIMKPTASIYPATMMGLWVGMLDQMMRTGSRKMRGRASGPRMLI